MCPLKVHHCCHGHDALHESVHTALWTNPGIIDKLFTPVPSKHCPSCKSWQALRSFVRGASPKARVALISLPLQLYNCLRFSERERGGHALVQRQLLTVDRVCVFLVNQWSLIQCTGFRSFCMFIILYHIILYNVFPFQMSCYIPNNWAQLQQLVSGSLLSHQCNTQQLIVF